jgi:hypothetical protein
MLTIKLSIVFEQQLTYEHTYITPNLLPGSSTTIRITISFPPARVNIKVIRQLAQMPRQLIH